MHKLGRITSVEIALGGRYNSELGLLVSMGAERLLIMALPLEQVVMVLVARAVS